MLKYFPPPVSVRWRGRSNWAWRLWHRSAMRCVESMNSSGCWVKNKKLKRYIHVLHRFHGFNDASNKTRNPKLKTVVHIPQRDPFPNGIPSGRDGTGEDTETFTAVCVRVYPWLKSPLFLSRYFFAFPSVISAVKTNLGFIPLCPLRFPVVLS